jgi:hypothetical protein
MSSLKRETGKNARVEREGWRGAAAELRERERKWGIRVLLSTHFPIWNGFVLRLNPETTF